MLGKANAAERLVWRGIVLAACSVLLLVAAPALAQEDAETVRFAVIGDYGTAGDDLQDVAEMIDSWEVDFIITLGDNNYPDGEADTIDDNVGQYFHRYIHPYLGGYGEGADRNRFFPTLGNHDYETEGAQPYLDYFTLPGNERYFDFAWGPVHLFAINSNPEEPDGIDGSSLQAQWLRDGLAASSAPWQIVYFHHAPYSSGERYGPTTVMQWPFVEWGAEAVMSGHEHLYERLVIDDVVYYINGIGGDSRRGFAEPYPGSALRFRDEHGAMLVEATTDEIRFDFYSTEDGGTLIDSYVIQADGTAFAPTLPGPIVASVETDPVPNSGDAADDPAIWVHPTDPSLSLILGTDKKGGLGVYDLSGREVDYLPYGRFNNVDLRYNFPLGGELVTLVAISNRSDDTIALYLIDADTRRLTNVASRPIEIDIGEAYGLCMYRSPSSNRTYVFVNDDEGEVEQWELFDDGNGYVDAETVRTFALESQTEGCVADDDFGYMYIAEEQTGIWRFGAEPDSGDEPVLVDGVGDDGHLTADVEGLTIYYKTDGTGYLIASSQGDNSFVVYERTGDNAYLGTFEIVTSDTIDRVNDTDGIDVTSVALGPDFPQGLFVAQDGRNDNDENQNFKLVPWEYIAVNLGLEIDTKWDPWGRD